MQALGRSSPAVLHALTLAVQAARRFEGATAPNPPVGAVALDAAGAVIAVGAHERAGTPHAEALVIAECERLGRVAEIATLVVTLEPCNHFGRTPPCTEAILKAEIPHVVYGAPDPNPRVEGGGAARLRAAGVRVDLVEDPESRDCRELIRPFARRITAGIPFVTVKTAHRGHYDLGPSMIPEGGLKTFSSASSLKLAHELRRRADAIITGVGTVIADRPELTVRHVADIPGKRRRLVVLERPEAGHRRTPADWIETARTHGFEVWVRHDYAASLIELARADAMEVLVEAGPTLSRTILGSDGWDRHMVILAHPDGDRVEVRDREETGDHVHGNH